MIQYQIKGLIQIKLATEPLCLISSPFLFELQLNTLLFPFRLLCDLSLSLPPFRRLFCYAHKKVPIRSFGRMVWACHAWESRESSSGLKKSDWSDNLFSWLISCFDFNELKSNTLVPPWQGKKRERETLVKSINYSRNQKETNIWGCLLGHSGEKSMFSKREAEY